MKQTSLFFVMVLFTNVLFGAHAAAPKCSQTNMTKCLDSACAINVGMNPAARCQYCGSSSAGTPPSQKGLSSLTVGQSAKNTLSAKELANAPSDPGKRYIWATTECIKKIGNCTADDVSNIYDKLIEQSCKAAGISMQTTKAMANLNQKPTKTSCNKNITACVSKKCGEYFDECGDNAGLDRTIAECAVDATGCDEYIKDLRQEFALTRDKATEGREAALKSLVQDYQNARKNKLSSAISGCTNGTNKDECIEIVCTNHMSGGCNSAAEQKMANLLCEFYDTACTALPKTDIKSLRLSDITQ